LCGLDELEGHGDARGAGAGSLGDPLAESDGDEGRLDRVGGAQVDPVLGRVVVEGEQHVDYVESEVVSSRPGCCFGFFGAFVRLCGLGVAGRGDAEGVGECEQQAVNRRAARR
jgi:hypothetical protein